MRKTVLVAMVALAVSAHAEILSDVVDGVTWMYSISNGVATVEERSGPFYVSGYEGDLVIPKALGGAPVERIGRCAFMYASNVSSIVIPEGVKSIGYYAFYACKADVISLPDSLEEIDDGCFCRCYGQGLTIITIPANVRRIGRFAFNETEFLRRIEVASGNRWYGAVNGVLYDKQLTRLIAAPARLVSLRIPATVREIDDYALSGLYDLDAIELPPSIRAIGHFAFTPGYYTVRTPCIVFLGDCPETADDAFWCYDDMPLTTVLVARGSSGWNCEIPGKWKGVSIGYLPDAQGQVGEWAKTATSRSPAQRLFGRSIALNAGGSRLMIDGSCCPARPHYVFALTETDDGTMLTAAIAPTEFHCSGFRISSASADTVELTTGESVVGSRYRIESSSEADFREPLERTPFVGGNGCPLVMSAPKKGLRRFYRIDVAD